ncbi:hypothetical protein CPC08DRAFT_445321 [Agrocybe pediades]|nr:hypothetical protein CPC08DRAFT_445321 [Agrocybe pediades]
MDRIDITDAVDQIIKPSWNIERPVYITPARPSKDRPSKKSHAKKKAPGHISRPMNKFMLFRHNFDDQKVIPPGVARNHTVISDYAGKVWHYLTPEQKEPWSKLADEVRIEHHVAHPNYKLPGTSPKKKGKRRGKAAVAVAKPPRIAPLPKVVPPAVVESPQGPAPANLVDTTVEHLPLPEPLSVKEEVADSTLSFHEQPQQCFSWHGCKGELKEGDDPSWLLHDPPCDDALEDLSELQYFHPPQCDTFSGDAINQINFDPVLCSWGGIRRRLSH